MNPISRLRIREPVGEVQLSTVEAVQLVLASVGVSSQPDEEAG